MTLRRTLTAAALLVFAASLSARLADKGPWKPILSEGDYKALVAAETKTLNATLAKGIDDKDDRKPAIKARNSAMMLAAYAQSRALAGKDAPHMAGRRDAALALAKIIADGKGDEAKKLAAGNDTKTGDPNAVDLSKGYDLADLMTQFKPERGGGKELEKKLKTFMQKRAPLSSAELKEASLSAWQMAIIAEFTEAMTPEADMGVKKRVDWIKWSHEMEDLAVSAAKTAGAAKPDDKAVKSAFRKLDDACARCHKVFRD